MLERAARRAAGRRPRAARGCPRPREDPDRQDARRGRRQHVQAHPVHARPGARRHRRHPRLQTRQRQLDVELGPVFANLLLADEINRAPAKVQSALLEVMQEQQVTIGGTDYPVPLAVPRARDAEPDRVRGHLPAARGPGRPLPDQAARRLPDAGRGGRGRRPLAARPGVVERAPGAHDLERTAATVAEVFVDRDVVGYAVALADATRRPAQHGLEDLAPFVEYGASPRGPIGLVHAARALAMLRGRRHVAPPTCATSRPTCCATAS